MQKGRQKDYLCQRWWITLHTQCLWTDTYMNPHKLWELEPHKFPVQVMEKWASGFINNTQDLMLNSKEPMQNKLHGC